MEWYALFYVCLLSVFGLFRVSCSVRAVRMHEMVSKFVVPSSRFPVPSPFFLGWGLSYCDIGSSSLTSKSMCSMCMSRFVRYVRCSMAGNGMYDFV